MAKGANRQLPDEIGCKAGALFNKALVDVIDEPVGELIELIARPLMPGSAPIELSAASPAAPALPVTDEPDAEPGDDDVLLVVNCVPN